MRPRSTHRWLNLGRLGTAVLGVLVVAVGIRGAWHSYGAAAPLVVGLLLIALAYFMSADLAELSGKWKDAQFMYRRGADLNRAETLRFAARATTEPDVKKQLEEIARDIEGDGEPGADATGHLTPREAAFQRVKGRLPQVLADESPESDEAREAYFLARRAGYLASPANYTTPEPYYMFIDTSSWSDQPRKSIAINFRWWGDWRISCEALSPDGFVSERVLQGSIFMQGNNFSTNYPDEFDGAPPLEPGEYVFTWRRVPRSPGTPTPILVRDRVELPSLDLQTSTILRPEREVTPDMEDFYPGGQHYATWHASETNRSGRQG